MLIGYARVSTIDQNLALQLDALQKAGCEKILEDKTSGGKMDRPCLQAALEFTREGDTILFCRLDRLGRSLKRLIEMIPRNIP
jgi:DNA invertase Pin-like site-specific DNA recombinase